MRLTDRFIVGLVIAAVIYLSWAVAIADAHYKPGQHNITHAVQKVWCGKSNRSCAGSEQALRIVHCETGGTYSIWATNGQYLGLFQMGSWERRTFGHGNNPWAQARAAHRYYRKSGWHPWECAYIVGLL